MVNKRVLTVYKFPSFQVLGLGQVNKECVHCQNLYKPLYLPCHLPWPGMDCVHCQDVSKPFLFLTNLSTDHVLDAGNCHNPFLGKVLQNGVFSRPGQRNPQEDMASSFDVSVST